MLTLNRITTALVAGMLSLAACSSPGREEPPPGAIPDSAASRPLAEIRVPIPEGADAEDRRQLEALRDSIAREVGVPRASSQAQCRVLPLGSKPCGGPWTYVVYSAASSDSIRLTRLARQFDALQSKVNLELGLASTCDMALPPETALTEGVCVASR